MNRYVGVEFLKLTEYFRHPGGGNAVVAADVEDTGQDALNGSAKVDSLLRSPNYFLKDGHHLAAVGGRWTP